MGQIKIEVTGSFPKSGTEIITAKRGGHAAAIGRAMILLADRLPEAIEQDHKLHDSGDLPPEAPWGREYKSFEKPEEKKP